MSLKGRSCWDMNVRMDDAEKLSLKAIGRFVAASEELRFEAEDRWQLDGWRKTPGPSSEPLFTSLLNLFA